uniref:Putative serine/threonine-protein kinase n=1 Tax=Ixodes ricinus TaxID=34613 RepID=A0A147BF32_IXORI
MLLLEAMLVVLMVTIEHRQCNSIPHAITSFGNEALSILLSSSIIPTRDSDGCTKQVFPKDLTGVLSLSCMKTCENGKEIPETDGNECIFTVTQSTSGNEATITVGTCKNGTCVIKTPVDCVTTSLRSGEEEDDDDEEEEEEEEDEEEGDNDEKHE